MPAIQLDLNSPKRNGIPKDPLSAITHLWGFLLSISGLIILIGKANIFGNYAQLISLSIFGASLILLYGASTIYHSLDISPQVNLLLRKIDHIMIYILIAGTYTPICTIALRGIWGQSLLISVWILGIAGIFLTMLWINAPRWLTTSIYILMGWVAIAALPRLLNALGKDGFAWLIGGGLFYTIGAVIYAGKWPKFSSLLGFHEIFHLFVLAGSFCHYYLIFTML